jgi:two-component system, NtrC family, sensor kinase
MRLWTSQKQTQPQQRSTVNPMVSSSDILAAKILIVDDREADVLLLERILRNAGYVSIQSTNDPHLVCELHRKNRYALILLDLRMPGMDGFQVMERLKEIETDSYLPVLVLTALPEHKLQALKAGAKDFVSKPFDLAEVVMRVHNMLEVRLLHLETKSLFAQVVAEQKVTKLAQAELIKSEKLAAAGRLAAVLAHEINNPLQAVANVLSLLNSSSGPDPQWREYAQLAQSELKRVVHLVRQSLGLFREATIPSAINVAELLDGVVTLYGKQLAEKSITVSTRYRLDGTIESYSGEIRQMFSTFLVNAIDASVQGGSILVRASSFSQCKDPAVRCLRISVADNGIGIPPHIVGSVFEPFESTKGAHGIGLGLWVTQGIVRRLGGTIRVRSSIQPGKNGTSFSLFLPDCSAQPLARPRAIHRTV